MRSTLKMLLIALIIMASVATVQAQGLVYSAQLVQISKFHEQSKIEARIETYRFGRTLPLACWFSTGNVLPISNTAVSHRVYGDFIGITKIKGEPYLTINGGLIFVKAVQTAQKGWAADLPNVPFKAWAWTDVPKGRSKTKTEKKLIETTVPALIPGGYSLEWRVPAYNEHNKLVIVVIPLNWQSVSTEIAGSHFMLQQAPDGAENMTDDELCGYLKGFVPIKATNPNLKSTNTRVVSNVQTQPIQPVQPQASIVQSPVIQPTLQQQVQPIPPMVEQVRPVETPRVVEQPKSATPSMQTVPQMLQSDGQVNTSSVITITPPVRTSSAPLPTLGSVTETYAVVVPAKQNLQPIKLALWKSGICNVYDIMFDRSLLTEGCVIRFRRNGQIVSEANYSQTFRKGDKIVNGEKGDLYVEAYLSDEQQWPLPQDNISTANRAVKVGN